MIKFLSNLSGETVAIIFCVGAGIAALITIASNWGNITSLL